MTKSWADLCERLLARLEAHGENCSSERAEFGVLMVDCCMRGCKEKLSAASDLAESPFESNS